MDRKIYRNAITQEEASVLIKNNYKGDRLLEIENPIVSKLLDMIKDDFDFTLHSKSYINSEVVKGGHAWHIDRGTYEAGKEGHMSWCTIGVSILLSNESQFQGGDTFYGEDQNGLNKIKVDRNQYDMCVHTSDVWHMVESHEGFRHVLLMFI